MCALGTGVQTCSLPISDLNYAGLSRGNIASASHAGDVSQPRAAALQGVEKMRHNLELGLAQGFFMPLDRPDAPWLATLGTTPDDAEGHLRAQAWSASSMWAANAATVPPAPDSADGKCHLTVANLLTLPPPSPEWPRPLPPLRLPFTPEERRIGTKWVTTSR